jgi:DNA repair protein RadA/Sms
MAKRSTVYVCQSCGTVAPRWTGKCPGCEAWNTLVEEVVADVVPGAPKPRVKGKGAALEALSGASDDVPRLASGLAELDRVTGGGLVAGSAILIGGEPGIGKSTLLLQAAAAVARRGGKALYFTGEEAAAQVRLRAERLGCARASVGLAADSNLANILATLDAERGTQLVVIDSIQTLWSDGLESAPGTVAQVRGATQALVRHAKQAGAALLLVGHVTKDGQIAGPKVVEHMVDTVLYFEGDRGQPFRILRAMKNRFGPTDEIGVFEMASEGLREVANPSELFLGDRQAMHPGAAVFAGVEGSRPILVEIQALVTPSSLGTPRRAVVGADQSRLAMLLAVLEARCRIVLATHDVYLNVAGGLRISEPAADLAAAAALVSSLSGAALRPDGLYFGEVSLSGAIRPAGQATLRLKEAQKLGFRRAVIPADGEIDAKSVRLDLQRISHLKQLADILG